MKKQPHIPDGNIVEEFMLGNTKIEIRDSAYINRTPEEIQATLDRIADIAIQHYLGKS